MMKEEFIKELVNIKERLLQEKEYIENPNTIKLFFLIKEGLRKNVNINGDEVSYAFQFDLNNNNYLSLSKVDTTKELMISLNGNIDEVLLNNLCKSYGIDMYKNNVCDVNGVYTYNFIANLNYTRVLK